MEHTVSILTRSKFPFANDAQLYETRHVQELSLWLAQSPFRFPPWKKALHCNTQTPLMGPDFFFHVNFLLLAPF